MKNQFGIGIYNFDRNDMYCPVKYDLNLITNKEYVLLKELKEGRFYGVENPKNKKDKLYQLDRITNNSSGDKIYHFSDGTTTGLRIIDKEAHKYSFYKKGFRIEDSSKSLNMLNFTMYSGNLSYRNLISIQKNGSITCDKRIFK